MIAMLPRGQKRDSGVMNNELLVTLSMSKWPIVAAKKKATSENMCFIVDKLTAQLYIHSPGEKEVVKVRRYVELCIRILECCH